MSANFLKKVYHFQKVSGKYVWKVNGSPTLYKQCLDSLTIIMPNFMLLTEGEQFKHISALL